MSMNEDMKVKLTDYMNTVFSDAPDTPENRDLKEELTRNLLDRYDDLTAEGRSPSAAYSAAIAGIGDIGELIGTAPAARTAQSAPAAPAASPAAQAPQPYAAAENRQTGTESAAAAKAAKAKKSTGRTVVRIVVWSIVAVLVIGTIATAFIFGNNLPEIIPGLQLHGCSVGFRYDMTGYTEGAQDISEIVRSLDIDWAAGKVNITVSPDTDVLTVREEVRNAGTDSPDSSPLYWKLENGKLFVRYCKSGLVLRSLKGKTLNVTFPAAWLAEGGELSEGLDSLNLDVASADVYVDVPAIRSADVDSASGTIELHGSFRDVNADSASGSVTVVGGADKFDADTASGAVSLYGRFGSIEADTASGRVHMELTAQPSHVECDTASGSVTIGLPADISGFTLDVDTASGQVMVEDFATVGAKRHFVYGNGLTGIEVDTASGNVRVYRYQTTQEGGAA